MRFLGGTAPLVAMAVSSALVHAPASAALAGPSYFTGPAATYYWPQLDPVAGYIGSAPGTPVLDSAAGMVYLPGT
jgi:hypothetical protein